MLILGASLLTGLNLGFPVFIYCVSRSLLTALLAGAFQYLETGLLICVICEHFSVKLAGLWLPALWFDFVRDWID
jgi:hypothetical protein